MYDPQPVNEYQITPDGYLRKAGLIIDFPVANDPHVDLSLLRNSADADAEAAKTFIRLEQTPVQTVGVPGLSL